MYQSKELHILEKLSKKNEQKEKQKKSLEKILIGTNQIKF